MTHKARPNDSKRQDKEYIMTAGVKKRLADGRGLMELLCGVCHKPILIGDVVVHRMSGRRTIAQKSYEISHARCH
jgi:hypothetical protein